MVFRDLRVVNLMVNCVTRRVVIPPNRLSRACSLNRLVKPNMFSFFPFHQQSVACRPSVNRRPVSRVRSFHPSYCHTPFDTEG